MFSSTRNDNSQQNLKISNLLRFSNTNSNFQLNKSPKRDTLRRKQSTGKKWDNFLFTKKNYQEINSSDLKTAQKPKIYDKKIRRPYSLDNSVMEQPKNNKKANKNSRSLPRFKFDSTKPFLGKFYYEKRKSELTNRLGLTTGKTKSAQNSQILDSKNSKDVSLVDICKRMEFKFNKYKRDREKYFQTPEEKERITLSNVQKYFPKNLIQQIKEEMNNRMLKKKIEDIGQENNRTELCNLVKNYDKEPIYLSLNNIERYLPQHEKIDRKMEFENEQLTPTSQNEPKRRWLKVSDGFVDSFPIQ
ncbi:unnamed protein product [Moneuplotes crassus]|uniref:Uncharacterized protein n=1 Tax=Euplotes crassus TaxID=5936 RepID=A0AAD1UIQ2_EUPCR|nr:unnamed protein product [Moneuplotes crassus]